MRKSLIALGIVLMLLSVVSVVFVSAQLYFSFPFQEFTTAIKDHPTNYAKDSWMVEITVSLAWNPNSTGYIMLHLANSTGRDFYSIQLHFARSIRHPNAFSLNVLVPTKVDPSAGDWVSVCFVDGLNETVTVSVKDRRLYVGSLADYKKYLGGYTVYPLVLANLRTEASANNVVTGGFMNVVLKDFTVIDTQALLELLINAMVVILPIVIIVTVMEKVFKRITKMGR